MQTREALKAFQRKLVSEKAHSLGWEFAPDEGHISAQFKSLMFGSAGLAGDSKVIQAAQDMFKRFAAGDRKAIHPNIRASVYAIALSNGGNDEFDVIWNEYKTTPDADERNTALRALGRVKSPELIKRAVSLPLSKDVKNQDIYMPLLGLRSEPQGVEAAWGWLSGNWEEILKVCPATLTMLGTLVKLGVSEFTTEKQAEMVQDFFKDKDKTGYKMALEQSLDGIRAKVGWTNRDRKDVESFLDGEALL